MNPIDDGYISPYLIHWTGKGTDGFFDDSEGARILSIISETRQLKLSYNSIYEPDVFTEIHEKMSCFTDVPLKKSASHCARYGRFGIAFHKLQLMNIGAQPVFYTTHVWKRDMDTIFEFLKQQVKKPEINKNLLRALLNHFYFTQHFSDGRADQTDTYYYEREWRIGAQSLPTDEELNRDCAKFRCVEEGYPNYIDKNIGYRVVDGENEYFTFGTSPVAFLIAPADWVNRIANPNQFKICEYEKLVSEQSSSTVNEE